MDIETRWNEEDAEDEEYRSRFGGARNAGLDVRDRLGLFVMVCSALVSVQAMLPKGL